MTSTTRSSGVDPEKMTDLLLQKIKGESLRGVANLDILVGIPGDL